MKQKLMHDTLNVYENFGFTNAVNYLVEAGKKHKAEPEDIELVLTELVRLECP